MLAKKFNVTTDYLLGVSDVATTDIEVKQICDYTGLTEEVVYVLELCQHIDDDKLYKAISTIDKKLSLSLDLFFGFTLSDFINFIVENNFANDIVIPIKEYNENYKNSVSELKALSKKLITEFKKSNYIISSENFNRNYEDVVCEIRGCIENNDRYLYKLSITIYEIAKKYAISSINEYEKYIKIIEKLFDEVYTTNRGGWTDEQANKFVSDIIQIGGD